jgi:putative component of toxin-antitoxin plasmid stabilization module
MVDIREYRDLDDRSPFREWFDNLNSQAAQKVTKALYRVGLGNFSNVKSIGSGVLECKMERNNANRTTSGLRMTDGKTTRGESSTRKKRNNQWL